MEEKKILDVTADRLRVVNADKVRVVEAIELSLRRGSGRINVFVLNDEANPTEPILWRWSTGLHCPESNLRYTDPQPPLFSFNSAFGA